MNILIDMDGVICTEEKTFERALATPLPGALESLRLLREQGHQIVIYTARSWAELAMTRQWLDEHEIPYDGLHMGKPVADRIIDDRAIPFSAWPAALEALARDARPDVDQVYLKVLRDATVAFLEAICADAQLLGPVLEVGPVTREGLNSPVLRAMPETYFDSRAAIERRGIRYLSLDMDPASRPDICCDFLECRSHLGAGSVGTLVMMSCLEHMPGLFRVPQLAHDLLAPGGRLFVLTPWNLRLHGPRPDCWRISDDGYQALFAPLFDVVSIEKIPCNGRPLSPVGFRCVFRKRA